ncbi:MAG: ATP phosphoribosyltransferase regulatory subunit [Clostridia bacterium]|nr:ATP phosphoribosyltransferase regulatory subunit [Clostridia bacterium]
MENVYEQRLTGLYESFGYSRFRTTKFEPYELYSFNRDFLRSGRIITFTDLDGSLKALKPDITLSVVKNSGGTPGKLYYLETVYRPRDHRFAELRQAGVECLGTVDDYSLCEVVALAAKSLLCFADPGRAAGEGGSAFLLLSDLELLGAVFDAFGVPDGAKSELTALFEAKNADGISSFCAKYGIEGADSLRELARLFLPLDEGLKRLGELCPAAVPKAERLRELSVTAELFGVRELLRLDLSTAGNLDYYNGLIFRGVVAGVPFNVLSGGQYDLLPARMGSPLGAVGFAVYLDEVENSIGAPVNARPDEILLYNDEKSLKNAALRANELRAAGRKVLVMNEAEYEKSASKRR